MPNILIVEDEEAMKGSKEGPFEDDSKNNILEASDGEAINKIKTKIFSL